MQKQIYENPLYEQRRNLDRQAGLSSETSGKKRKHDDDEKGGKEKDEKNKHKKEKRSEDDNERDEDEDKTKLSKKEDVRCVPLPKEESPYSSKMDEDDKYKHKKEERYRSSREEDERPKFSRRDDGDRYKHSKEEEYRNRHRRKQDDRYDNKTRHGPRDDKEMYKSDKYSDSRSKHDEQEEGKSKAERGAVKKPESGKSEVSKQSDPPKPYDPPKVFCGPSPAMRAKLRKQSQEAGKPTPANTTASFGKFTWKKRENQLVKEAEKVAADFIKEDEAASKEKPMSTEDSFSKSVAFAKEIAEKLSANAAMPPPCQPSAATQGRIRPNLPAPAAVMRRTTTMGKPAHLNTFLSMRPQNSGGPLPPPKYDPVSPAQELQIKPQAEPPVTMSKSPLTTSAPQVTTSTPPLSAPSVSTCVPGPQVTVPAPTVSRPPEAKPAPSEADVPAPGVPESEQAQAVFVKPPPFLKMTDGPQRSERFKSHLAAAKAKDLFDIYYNSGSQSTASALHKPLTADNKVDGNRSNKSPVLPLQAPKPQPHPLNSLPPTEVPKSSQPKSNSSPLGPKEPPRPDTQIPSVWTLQTAASQPQPNLTPAAQKEAQFEPQPDRDTQHQIPLQVPSEVTPANESVSIPSHKTRGKNTTAPVRQTRSQTRYQTRQQQLQVSQPEDQSLNPHPEDGTPTEDTSKTLEITPETLGLPSDMTSLDFDYDFNFE